MSLCNSISPGAGNTVITSYTGPRWYELPPEIRCMIYHHVFTDSTMRLVAPGAGNGTYCSIRRTCKALGADSYLEEEMLRSSTIAIPTESGFKLLKRRLDPHRLNLIRRLSIDTTRGDPMCRDSYMYGPSLKGVTLGALFMVQDVLDLSSKLHTLTVRLENVRGTNPTRHVFDYSFKNLCVKYDRTNPGSVFDSAGNLRPLEGYKDLIEYYRQPFRYCSYSDGYLKIQLDQAHEVLASLFQYTFLRSYYRNALKFGFCWYDELMKGAIARGIEIIYEFDLHFRKLSGIDHFLNKGLVREESEIWEQMEAAVSTKDWIMRVKDGDGKIWEFKQYPLFD